MVKAQALKSLSAVDDLIKKEYGQNLDPDELSQVSIHKDYFFMLRCLLQSQNYLAS
jgi:hypothetical protein